jgi:SCY1-like protein 1
MQEEAFFDAPSQTPKAVPSAANPFGDDGEPDFAGWLAAQAGKKPGSKPLPKGLAKTGVPTANRSASGGVTTMKKAAGMALKPKPIVAKKINTAPKEADNDDGWGDGW